MIKTAWLYIFGKHTGDTGLVSFIDCQYQRRRNSSSSSSSSSRSNSSIAAAAAAAAGLLVDQFIVV